ncbi:hypothetical protein B0H66DRAFT_238418 [Apodospora peruviana]|uniref:Uncharacterized protein n=1 Tax=Apodospora peruviana TaxID=516989 RepID=A0AAE0M5C7_9PEZI|nr:hypothetical protein B0H66DRAFT_238418 [Apodospora peruviana]
MKASTIFVSLFATMAAAAPTEKRANFDLGVLNNLSGFSQVNLNYLLNINSLDLNQLGQLGQLNNFDILSFQNLFQAQQFDLAAVLQLQQLQMVLQFQQLGLFNGFDLASLQLQQLQLGLLNNVGVLDLQQFVPQNVVAQVQTVASQVGSLGQFGQFGSSIGSGVSSGSAVPAAQVGADVPDSGVVTAAEQDAQEGGSSLN